MLLVARVGHKELRRDVRIVEVEPAAAAEAFFLRGQHAGVGDTSAPSRLLRIGFVDRHIDGVVLAFTSVRDGGGKTIAVDQRCRDVEPVGILDEAAVERAISDLVLADDVVEGQRCVEDPEALTDADAELVGVGRLQIVRE